MSIKSVIRRFVKHKPQYYKDRIFRRVNEKKLGAALRSIFGVESGCTLYIQSSFGSLGYYPNGMPRFLALLQGIIGRSGTIVMPCFPFGGSMEDFVRENPLYDARHSPSKIGALPEIMRHMPGVRRSCHPTHPVVALGGNADWIVADHENCSSPQGDGSPFDKLVQCDALVLRINTPAFPLCHRLQEIVDWPNLFVDEVARLTVVDDAGRSKTITTKVYRKRVPFVMYLPGSDPTTPVASNIIDFPIPFESREYLYSDNADKLAARQLLLSYRKEFEENSTRRAVRYNDCLIDAFPAGQTMGFAVDKARELINRFEDYYALDELTAQLADGSIRL